METLHHISDKTWTHGPNNEARGYIDAEQLKELWFHTGTVCNLQCPFCLEGSGPNVHRIEMLTLADAQPFIEEAVQLGVKQFSFTGGEPFVIPEFPDILELALTHRPCLVLTNGTEPLFENMPRVRESLNAPHPLRFRVSIDHADERRHDGGRGEGNFRRAIDTMRILEKEGFELSVARHRANNEDVAKVDNDFREMFADHGLNENMGIVSFPEFFRPNTPGRTPVITEDCMTEHHTKTSRSEFMCAYSRMVVKKNGRCGVYACTLVDDDPDYDLGDTLTDSMRARVMLRHHRCFSCFACGASCSDPNAAL